MPFPLSPWKLNNHFFNNFSIYKVFICSRSSTVRGVNDVHMQGDVAHNMYSISAVYQNMFNDLIEILHSLVDGDLF